MQAQDNKKSGMDKQLVKQAIEFRERDWSGDVRKKEERMMEDCLSQMINNEFL